MSVQSVSPDRRSLLATVADLYYVEDRSQQAIANSLGMSRSKVSRLLSEARDTGVVEVRIHHQTPVDEELQAALGNVLEGITCIVVNEETDHGAALRAIGDRAARLLESELKPGDTLALTHGSTVFEVVRALRTDQFPGLSMVQMAGFEVRNPLDNGWQLIRLCVDKLGSSYRYIHTQLLLASPGLYDAVVDDPDNRDVLDRARAADVAVLGIGSVDPTTSSLTRAGHLTQEQLSAARERGSIAAINGFHYNLDGELLEPLNQRIVGLSPPELLAIPLRLAVASGPAKAAGVLGAVRAGWITALITNPSCAREITRLATRPGTRHPAAGSSASR